MPQLNGTTVKEGRFEDIYRGPLGGIAQGTSISHAKHPGSSGHDNLMCEFHM